MELAVHAHSSFEFGRVGRIKITRVGDEPRDFPSALRITDDEGAVQSEISGQFEGGEFGATINQVFSTYPGVAINVFFVANGEVA